MDRTLYTAADFDHSPFIAFYEITRACDLICQHCRACAQPRRHPRELTTEEAQELFSQFASFPKPPMVVISGGDPMKRDDLYDLVGFGTALGLHISITPSATPLLTEEALAKLKTSGIRRIALSIDGANAHTHDGLRGVKGSFQRTVGAVAMARALDIPIQINTTITLRNSHQVDAMANLLAEMDIAMWSVFFLIPVGRGSRETRVSAADFERIFERLWYHAQRQNYAIKTTEAHHYRRFVLQKAGNPQHRPAALPPTESAHRAPLGVNDGKGVMFVSHTGEIYPSGFMPILCGNARKESIVDVYQRHPLFKMLRTPDELEGKCGFCEYRHICGGSRARAYAVYGEPMAQEPDCLYVPPAFSKQALVD